MRMLNIGITLLLIGLLLIPSGISVMQPTTTTSLGDIPLSKITNTNEKFASIRTQRLWDFSHPLHTSMQTSIYHTYDEMTALFESLAQNHSDIMSLTSLGTTYEGRALWLVKLSDNVTQTENEPSVLFLGAHHGNEKPSYEILISFIQYMIDSYENNTGDIRQIINTTEIYLIPMVNPDGVAANARKNLEPNHGWFGLQQEVTSTGVDVNRNYGFHWMLMFLFPRFYLGSTSFLDASDVYRGPYPFSEAETKAVRDFIETHDIGLSISYHTFGELVLYPWGYTPFPPKDESLFVSIGQNITALDNYTLGQSIELYPTLGDACDWMYGSHNILAYTIELGQSYAPEDQDILNEMSQTHTLVNLYICRRAQDL